MKKGLFAAVAALLLLTGCAGPDVLGQASRELGIDLPGGTARLTAAGRT